MLRAGGARFRFPGPTEAKRIGRAFVDALVGERHGDFAVYRSGCAWTRWFWDIAWDCTLLLIDARRAEIFLLCLTDTDRAGRGEDAHGITVDVAPAPLPAGMARLRRR